MLPKVSGPAENHVRLSTPNAELGEKDPDQWWNTFEVNVRGVYNIVRYVYIMMSLQRIGS